MKSLILTLVFWSTNLMAGHGASLMLWQGAGYIYQGDEWQFSAVVNTHQNRFRAEDNIYSYKVLVRKDIADFEKASLTLGWSLNQSFVGTKLESFKNAWSIMTGVRFSVSEKVQIDLWTDAASYVEYFTISRTGTKSFDEDDTGYEFFRTAGIALSYLF